MKKFGILILALSVFASVGCNRSEQVAEPDPGGAPISELGDIYEIEEEKPKKKGFSLFGRKREEDGAEDLVGEDISATPHTREVEPEKPKKPTVDRAAEALAAAKVHIELGDYDFAGDELRKIEPDSALYQEAQRLLEEYR